MYYKSLPMLYTTDICPPLPPHPVNFFLDMALITTTEM